MIFEHTAYSWKEQIQTPGNFLQLALRSWWQQQHLILSPCKIPPMTALRFLHQIACLHETCEKFLIFQAFRSPYLIFCFPRCIATVALKIQLPWFHAGYTSDRSSSLNHAHLLLKHNSNTIRLLEVFDNLNPICSMWACKTWTRGTGTASSFTCLKLCMKLVE